MRIEWSEHAVTDLEAISAYIEQDRNLETANRVRVFPNSRFTGSSQIAC
jgi:plasmid stabilization system protein ParE